MSFWGTSARLEFGVLSKGTSHKLFRFTARALLVEQDILCVCIKQTAENRQANPKFR